MSEVARTVAEAVAILNAAGDDPYPLTVIPAWTLGSVGRVNVCHRKDFEQAVERCLSVSPTTEVGLSFHGRAASADTRPEGGDAKQAPFTSGAVAESEKPK